MAEIEAQFPDVLTLRATEFADENSGIGVPSTVAKWIDGGWEILRMGAIRLEI